MAAPPRDALSFPESSRTPLASYLPTTQPGQNNVFVTLTFATSLDSSLALSPGVQTHLSGPESKAMTHYLRSKHDAILIGAGTAIADNPSLNCRLEGVGGYGGEELQGQPRPIVIDPRGRWEFTEKSKVFNLAREGKGKAPFIISAQKPSDRQTKVLEECKGKWIIIRPTPSPSSDGLFSTAPVSAKIEWPRILEALSKQGISSLMIEGGGTVINDLLSPANISLVDSVIVTIAPTWLGRGGVLVCPEERVEDGVRVPVSRLQDVRWLPLGEDVVLAGRPISGTT